MKASVFSSGNHAASGFATAIFMLCRPLFYSSGRSSRVTPAPRLYPRPMDSTIACFFTILPTAGFSTFSAAMKPLPSSLSCSKGRSFRFRSWLRFPAPTLPSGSGPSPTAIIAVFAGCSCCLGAGSRSNVPCGIPWEGHAAESGAETPLPEGAWSSTPWCRHSGNGTSRGSFPSQ